MIVDVLSMVDIELGALDDEKSREKFIALLSSAKVMLKNATGVNLYLLRLVGLRKT